MKNVICLIIIIIPFSTFAQTPVNDENWNLNTTFSDEFNSTRKSIWVDLSTDQQWGQEIFRSSNIGYGNDGGRNFLRFTAEGVSGIFYSGGIKTGFEDGHLGLGFGYYEIEARLIETSGIQSGLWPAFWTIHSWKTGPPYWYEEIDIYEPANCQVQRGEHVVGLWHEKNNSNPVQDNEKEEGIYYDVDMSNWHKYAVVWTPDKLLFYIDDIPFFRIAGDIVPSHQNTNLLIDLQVDPSESGWCFPNITNGILGYFDINYFRYHELEMDCTDEVTASEGNGFNFSTFDYKVKKSFTISNTTVPSGGVTLRATDFIEISGEFEVPLGSDFVMAATPCY